MHFTNYPSKSIIHGGNTVHLSMVICSVKLKDHSKCHPSQLVILSKFYKKLKYQAQLAVLIRGRPDVDIYFQCLQMQMKIMRISMYADVDIQSTSSLDNT